MTRSTLCGAAGVVALVWALGSASAHAQSAGADSPAVAAKPATPPQAEAAFGIEEIVVTAQKRSENVQRTAAAVTAVTGERLTAQGVTDLRAVQAIVPAARFQQEGNSTQVFLRGVGSNLDFGNIEPTVAFNFNGIYIPREGTSAPLFDLERLEVLPGPQGTLYGRSALGGTINVAFKRPTHERETQGSLELGNYDLAHVSLAQNIPLAPDLALRGAVDYTYHKGYMESGADSKDDLAARLSLLYDPTAGFTLYAWGYGVTKNGHSPNLVNKGFDPATGAYSENAFLRDRAWDDLRPGALAALAPFGQPGAESQTYDNWVAGAQVDIDLADHLTLTYIPSYFYLDSASNYWLGGVPASISQHYNQTTHELRLSGASPRFQWLAGLYGYHVVNHGQFFILPGYPFAQRGSDVQRNMLEGVAGFGQGTYSLSDTLRLTVGGRYTIDHRTGRGVSPADGAAYSADETFHRFDYKLGVEYDVAPSAMLYATYQTGYQPGTYNEAANTPTFSNRIKPATLSALTGGFKTRFFDNRLQVNNELFYYDYHNLFIQSFDQSKAFNPIFNAEKVEVYGDQLDVTWKPSSNDQVTLNLGYLHARNKKFVIPVALRVPNARYDFAGFSPPYASDWTASASYAHDFHFSTGYVRAQADARYEAPFYADYVHNPGVRQKGAIKENASITWYADNGGWGVGAWIKNISNKAVIAATAAAGIPGPATAYLEAPRTFGMRLTFNFK